jgi:hypothetical protein
MDLEQAIRQRWGATPALDGLLPVSKLKTGLARGDTLPYATLARTGSRPALRTAAGDAIDEVAVRITIWHGDYDGGSAIVGQVAAAFDHSDFALAGGGRVIQMRRTNLAATEHDDGAWQFTIEFLAEIHIPSES